MVEHERPWWQRVDGQPPNKIAGVGLLALSAVMVVLILIAVASGKGRFFWPGALGSVLVFGAYGLYAWRARRPSDRR
jgi:hypothetical protein